MRRPPLDLFEGGEGVPPGGGSLMIGAARFYSGDDYGSATPLAERRLQGLAAEADAVGSPGHHAE
ncbi:MAG: hypothetical protein U0793_04595 [Gemmataceae bacterium]